MKLRYEYSTPEKLSEAEICRLFSLMEETYDSCDKGQFIEDLLEKDDLILLKDQANTIQGFTTLISSSVCINGEQARVVFSGDTLISREYWGTPTLAVATVRYFCKLYNKDMAPLYWILISKGYRTYRFMPLYFHEFWPRLDSTIPAQIKAIRDKYITKKYGSRYNSERAIISADESQYYLNSEQQECHGSSRPDVAFFLEANPGYTKGDELVCICEISPENFRPIIKRFKLNIPNFD